MTAPNDVAALVERMRQQIAHADADIADALLDAETTGEPVDPDDWHVEVPVNWLRETVASLSTIAALQAEVERAKEDTLDRLYLKAHLQSNHLRDGEKVRLAGWLLGQGAMLPAARSASRKENTP